MPPSADDLAQSDDWKQKGNLAFRSKNYQEALSHYTTALHLNPSSQTLFSNRAAANLSLHNLPSALADAQRAVDLDPSWSKGYRRKASVLDAMHRFREALVVYEEALEITRKDPDISAEQREREEKEVKKLMLSLKKKLALQPGAPGEPLRFIRDPAKAPGVLVVKEVEARMQRGEKMGDWPVVGSTLRRIWIAEMQWHNALLHLNEFHTRPMEVGGKKVEAIVGRLQTLEELTTAMVEDVRVARFAEGELEKLQLCFRLEQQQRNAVGPQMGVEETIAEYGRRLEGKRPPAPLEQGGRVEGWDYVRPGLQLSIRSALMNAMLESVFDRENGGVEKFRRCVELIEKAREKWHDVDGGIRGRTLEETFLRQVKVHYGEALLQTYNHTAKTLSDAKKRELLDRIEVIGEWIIKSFESKSHPPKEEKFSAPAGEAGWWGVYYTHYAAPLAKAHMLLGFANLHYGTDLDTVALDAEDGRRGPIASSPSRLGMAAIHYIKAAGWMPIDEPERENALWLALFAMVRRGGYYLADFEVVRDMALKAPEYFRAYFLESVPEGHCGKLAAGEVLGTAVGAPSDMICSPMVTWPDGVEIDDGVLREVMEPWTKEIVVGEGGGMLALTEVLRQTWKERVEKWGEKPELMRAGEMWSGLDEKVKKNWENCWTETKRDMMGDTNMIFMG